MTTVSVRGLAAEVFVLAVHIAFEVAVREWLVTFVAHIVLDSNKSSMD